MGLLKTRDPTLVKIKMPNPSQDPPSFSKAPNQDFKDMDVVGAFKFKIENINLECGSTKDQWPYKNQDQDANQVVTYQEPGSYKLGVRWLRIKFQEATNQI